MEKKPEKTRPQKTVFVQNLPFTTTNEKLKETFAKFGEIKQCFVVADKNKPENNCKGVGYVIFANEDSSKSCVKNKLKLGGRRLRVYFAKPKAFIKGAKTDENKSDLHEQSDDDEELLDSPNSRKRKKSESEDMEVDDDDDDEVNNTNKKSSKIKTKSDENSDSDDSGDDVDEDEEEEDGDDDDDEGDVSNDHDDNEDSDKKSRDEKLKNINDRDAEDGKTLFVRNLSFDSVEDDLEELFEEFGTLNYCRIVVNKKTQHSQGAAFVRFRFKKDAENCLKAYEENSEKFIVNGRKLTVMMALTKDKAQQISEEKKTNVKKGSQKNLHLIRLLLIRPGTKAAEGLSQEDLMKRLKVEAITREKLKNPNVFVSPTRLCIRNIPIHIDEKQLKKEFLKAANDRSAKITECRIMRDLSRPNGDGIFKSKGFGFVEFTKHEHSLAAALATNNNPDIFGDKRRLIVEFSLENKSALEVKQKRLLNSQAKLKSVKLKNTKHAFQYPTPAPNSNPKQKALPSHWGAKVRHKPRKSNQDVKNVKKQKQNKFERRDREPRVKKRKTIEETNDHLDDMISVYRNKFKSVYDKEN